MMQRLALLGFVMFSVSVMEAQGPGQAASASVLPITRVVLYKTGVGLFEHVATVTGNQALAVQFTGDQLDDVLQSLTAVDLGDGRVAGISYDSPTPTERRLQALRLPLGPKATLLQLLESLRGSRIEVRSPAGAVTAGRLLNAERRLRPGVPVVQDRDELTLVTDVGEIRTIEITSATRIRIVDADQQQEVGRYLAIAAANDERSPRRLVLSTVGTGARQVFVSYVGQSAVWKSTYRLVFPTSGPQQPFLQGWAIVDNVSGADWENVDLSLVAGAPQTFTQPLSTPLFTVQPVVPISGVVPLMPQAFGAPLTITNAQLSGVIRDTSGAVLPGVTVEVSGATLSERLRRTVTDGAGRYTFANVPSGAFTLAATLAGFNTAKSSVVIPRAGESAMRDLVMRVGALEETITVSGEIAPVRIDRNSPGPAAYRVSPAPSATAVEARLQEQVIAASAAEVGDLFEYHLRDRVTIRRNQSALVPILQAKVKAERVSVWNELMGARPRRAVWLTNGSDLTLDGGSLGVYDAGAFAGEGLIDSIKPGERRLISYASDIGVQVSRQGSTSPQHVVRVRIARGLVTQDHEERESRKYVIRNDNREARLVILEHPVRSGWSLVDVLAEESTATVHRFRITVPAGDTATFSVTEARRSEETYAVNAFNHGQLVAIVEGPRRVEIETAMQPIYTKSGELDDIDDRIEKLEAERQGIGNEQTRLRQNMAALKGSKAERQLLERYTRQMNDQETRLAEARREQASLEERKVVLERELASLIDALVVDLTLQ